MDMTDFQYRDRKDITKSACLDLYDQIDRIVQRNWGWCSKHRMGWMIDIIDEFFQKGKIPTIVEIGSYCGKGTVALAMACKIQGVGKVISIDPLSNEEATRGYDDKDLEFWSNVDFEEVYNIFNTVIRLSATEDYVEFIRKPSNEYEPPEEIDFLIIDGQHTEQVLDDIDNYASRVPDGGILYVDDLKWIEKHNPEAKLYEMGFELFHYVDKGGCYKRTVKKDVPTFELNISSDSTMWIVDNFYQDPDKVREFALQQEYDEGGIGRGYIGNRTHDQFLFPDLKLKFEHIMGKKISNWETYGMNGRFQYSWSGNPLVYHTDQQQWGGMIYLTPDAPYECGTTMYASKTNRARTYYDDGWSDHWQGEGDPHLDPTPWQPVDVAGNVYNRLVIFDASCIHAASQYFGTVKDNCRLWQMFFFDTF